MIVLTDARGRWRWFAFSRTLAEESTDDVSTPISASLAVVAISTFVHVCVRQSNIYIDTYRTCDACTNTTIIKSGRTECTRLMLPKPNN